MFYGFQATAKAANLTTIPISFGQIILCESNPFFRNHKKNLNFQREFHSPNLLRNLNPIIDKVIVH
jgi:hypothetical protein